MKLFWALFDNLVSFSWNSKTITPYRLVLSSYSSLLPPAGQLNVTGPSWPTVSVSLYCSLLTTPLDQRKTKEIQISNRKVNEESERYKTWFGFWLVKIHSYPERNICQIDISKWNDSLIWLRPCKSKQNILQVKNCRLTNLIRKVIYYLNEKIVKLKQ